MNEKIVLALGGNALGYTPDEQKQNVKTVAKTIASLIEQGKKLVITHGNGPQVGLINLAMSTSHLSNEKTPEMPFAECGAMSQGYIGFHLQNAIKVQLEKKGIHKPVISVLTQTLVDENDKAFKNPTKPIGSFYSEKEAEKISKEKNYIFKEDSNRGYRRVIASPIPIDIIEKETIKKLINMDTVVISGGGGGIPVIEKNGELIGVDAVVDKDFTSEKIAEIINADMLVILTSLEKVAINYGKENQKNIDEISVEESEKYIREGQFAKGSMLPKVEACIKFVKERKNKYAVISSLDKAIDAILGKAGTKFRRK